MLHDGPSVGDSSSAQLETRFLGATYAGSAGEAHLIHILLDFTVHLNVPGDGS